MIRYYSVPKETFVTNGTIVEPLNVTENGTYAPPAGTAYSPVIVNVEGGGGSSDFSTAEVTITQGDANSDAGSISVIRVQGDDIYEIALSGESPGVFTIVLYKGHYYISADSYTVKSVSGNVTFDAENEEIDITGDCTLVLNYYDIS